MARKSREQTKQLRILSQSVLLEEASTASLVRGTMLIICICFIVFVTWASFAQITERATATGEIIPSGHVQSIQHLEGGIVESILVHDDQLVSKNQVLLHISGDAIQSDFERIQSKLRLLELQAARLESFLSGDKVAYNQASQMYPDIASSQGKILDSMVDAHEKEKHLIRQQITQKKKQVTFLKQELSTAKKNLIVIQTSFATQDTLYQERLVAESTYLSVVRELNGQQGKVDSLGIKILQAIELITEYEIRLQSVISTAKSQALQQLGVIEAEKAETVELYEKIEMQVQRLAVKSPLDGIVKGLNIHTVGGVIAPGSQLMEIVPTTGDLLAEIKVSPNDIGHIKTGDPVIVKITSYDFAKYGTINGTITGLSATTFTNEKGLSFYKGIVSLEKSYIGKQAGQNIILPGMIVNADIITGQKSLLEYFLKPIHKALNSAFTER